MKALKNTRWASRDMPSQWWTIIRSSVNTRKHTNKIGAPWTSLFTKDKIAKIREIAKMLQRRPRDIAIESLTSVVKEGVN